MGRLSAGCHSNVMLGVYNSMLLSTGDLSKTYKLGPKLCILFKYSCVCVCVCECVSTISIIIEMKSKIDIGS